MAELHHLVIDQGNTTTKIGVFKNGELVKHHRVNDNEWSHFFQGEELPSSGIYSSVRASLFIPEHFFLEKKTLVNLKDLSSLPIDIDYETPDTLGTDRIANAVGAIKLFPQKNKLIIDCGTCITATFVASRTLKGGSISPGLGMRLKATHEYTGKLPLLRMEDLKEDIHLIGKNTKASIASGIVLGAVNEIDHLIQNYCSRFADLSVILTGGDASFFASRLKSPIFAEPNLTLKGLNEIYIHTAH